MTKKVTIYTLSDPITGLVRYVGKTQRTLAVRLCRHLNDTTDTYKDRWIKTLNGVPPIIEALELVDEASWEEAEKFWICTLRFYGFKLTNTGDGGLGGVAGVPKSEETKDKIRRRHLGHQVSAETRIKISKSLTGRVGRKHTESSIAKFSSARIASANFGRKLTPSKIHKRQVYGERSHHAKIRLSDVTEIRSLAGKMSQEKIGLRFGIRQSQVSRIITGRKWAHVCN